MKNVNSVKQSCMTWTNLEGGGAVEVKVDVVHPVHLLVVFGHHDLTQHGLESGISTSGTAL